MPIITIQGTVIEFPNTASAPSWSEAVIQFAQAVELALQQTAGAFDVPPQTLNIDAQNPGTNISIAELAFPVSEVRKITISYAVVRQTSLSNVSQEGTIEAVYNINNPVNNKFERRHNYSGDASITFDISDTGQVSFSTAALSGTGHTGTIIFSAKALQNTY